MALIKGTGLSRRGWRHEEGGGATATLWLTVLFLPVVPYQRHRLRVLDPSGFDRAASGYLAGYVFDVPVKVVERLPLSVGEISRTYFWTYFLLPLLCIWPGLAFIFVSDQFTHGGKHDPLGVPEGVLYGFVVVAIANALIILLTTFRRARGVPPKAPRPDDGARRSKGPERPSLNERYPVGQRP